MCPRRDGNNSDLPIRNVVAPPLEDFGAALQQVGSLIRLNDLASRDVGQACLRDMRRDAGLGHPRPRARPEPVNRRVHSGTPKYAPRRVPRQQPAGLRGEHQRRFGGQRPRPLKHIECARAQRDTELAPGLHPRRPDRPPRRFHLVPLRRERLSGPEPPSTRSSRRTTPPSTGMSRSGAAWRRNVDSHCSGNGLPALHPSR